MRETRSYLTGLIFKGMPYFLVWQTVIDGVDEDRILAEPGQLRPLIAKSIEEIERVAEQNGLLLELEPPFIYDVDALFEFVGGLGPETPLDNGQCELLLNCWNMFEDMAKSFSVHLPDMEGGEGIALDEIYSKLFYGNNLLPMTSEDEPFEPEFSEQEIGALRAYFSNLWAEFYALSPILWSGQSSQGK